MFSRPDATEEQFLFACRTARVDEFAERFPEGLRNHRRRARRQALRRAAPAPVDRARAAGRAAHSHSRRSHQLARLRIGGDDPGRPRRAHAGPDDICHRPPALHHPPRRPDSRGRRRAASSSAAITPSCSRSAAATTTSTCASTALKRISFSLPAKATRWTKRALWKSSPRSGQSHYEDHVSGAVRSSSPF